MRNIRNCCRQLLWSRAIHVAKIWDDNSSYTVLLYYYPVSCPPLAFEAIELGNLSTKESSMSLKPLSFGVPSLILLRDIASYGCDISIASHLYHLSNSIHPLSALG